VNNKVEENCLAMVDVIVPIYNQAEYVYSLLSSLCTEQNATMAELIVIDDCSTDKSTIDLVRNYEIRGSITALKNHENMGFTRTVNRGMTLHRDRDVVLLNSDTLVHGDWLDRMVACAYSGPNIATVNPLTTQYGSHISCYPGLVKKFDGDLELSGSELAALCAKFNDRHYVDVHTTVGFCMYIRRKSLDNIGFFDAKNFPTGYGEETDFCYRARKAGWHHRVAGDAYVEHFNGKSFGERAYELKQNMVAAFSRLHTDGAYWDRRFVQEDPIRPLRKKLDIGRLKRMLRGAREIQVVASQGEDVSSVSLALDIEKKQITLPRYFSEGSFPNFGIFKLPRDIVTLNGTLALMGVDRLIFKDRATYERFQSLVAGKPYEIPVTAEVFLDASGAMTVDHEVSRVGDRRTAA
jgi:GT2 family glycosyltransferase